MDFSTAYYKMLNGAKIKMPSWGGYWVWENNTIMMHCKNGNILDIRCTDNVAWTFGFIASNEWVVMDDEKPNKPKFRLEDYPAENNIYCMHCDTEEKADMFCNLLAASGHEWSSGNSYKNCTRWEDYGASTVYYFNEGTICDKCYAEFDDEDNPIILEFDDFDWS